MLLSVDGTQDVPLYLRNSPDAGVVVEILTPCSATTRIDVEPVASPVWAVCEKVPVVRVIPKPAA